MTIKNDSKINIAMVGYYNTLPFLHGLKKSDEFNLILDTPSQCINYYNTYKADIALVPVATLLDRKDYKIVTDYCIGCIGDVRTVCLFTNDNLEHVTKIYLDQDSRTSQLLVKILCDQLWNIQPDFEERNVREIDSDSLGSDEAILMIGDKVFEKEDSFDHQYDLGIEWEKLTNLPFTFAVWIARNEVDDLVIQRLNKAIGLGVNDIAIVLQENDALATKIDLEKYFTDYIDFHFDGAKKEAFRRFSAFNCEMSKVVLPRFAENNAEIR